MTTGHGKRCGCGICTRNRSKLYTVTLPDGGTKTRTSHRVYTHVVAVRRGTGWDVTSFCGSLDLAGKELAAKRRDDDRLAERTDLKDFKRADEFRILPVTVEVR